MSCAVLSIDDGFDLSVRKIVMNWGYIEICGVCENDTRNESDVYDLIKQVSI